MIVPATRHRVANVASLVLTHFDGTNGSTTFTDVYGHTISAVGAAALSTGTVKFGTASLQTGVNDYATVTNSGGFLDVWSGDVTVEGWGYLPALTGTSQFTFASHVPNSGAAGAFQINVSIPGDQLGWALSDSSVGAWTIVNRNTGSGVTSGVWHHYAIVKHGTVFTLYYDGTSIDSVTSSLVPLAIADPMCIGGYASGAHLGWNGYIDEFRFSPVARYTSNFTPTGPFTY